VFSAYLFLFLFLGARGRSVRRDERGTRERRAAKRRGRRENEKTKQQKKNVWLGVGDARFGAFDSIGAGRMSFILCSEEGDLRSSKPRGGRRGRRREREGSFCLGGGRPLFFRGVWAAREQWVRSTLIAGRGGSSSSTL
jgi:hypothetical protein